MKVVLLQDVPKIGKKGEVKEVSDGYGRNFLLPQKLVLPATPSALKMVEGQLRQEAKRQQLLAAELEKLAQQLEGLCLTFKSKVVSEDQIYGSIRDVHIAQEISRLTGFDVDKGSIELEESINRLGSYEVAVKLGQALMPKVKVIVEEGKEME